MTLASFFSPLTEPDKTFIEGLLPQIYPSIEKKLLACLDEQQSNLLTETYQQNNITTTDADGQTLTMWLPQMGAVNQLMNQGTEFTVNALVQQLLVKVGLGFVIEFSQPTVPGSCLYFGVNQIITGTHFSLRFTAEERVCIDNGIQLLEFVKSDSGWVGDAASPQASRLIRGCAVLCDHLVDPHMLLEKELRLSTETLDQACEQISQAMVLIDTMTPEYSSWISRVLRQINLVRLDRDDVTISRSAPSRPGAIVMSHPSRVVAKAEMLVHECSHQYYYLGCFISSMRKNPADNSTFYSPIIKRERPIERILVSYHALVNIIMFYELLLSRSDEYQAIAINRIREMGSMAWQNYQTLQQHQHLLSDNANQMWQAGNAYVQRLFDQYSLND